MVNDSADVTSSGRSIHVCHQIATISRQDKLTYLLTFCVFHCLTGSRLYKWRDGERGRGGDRQRESCTYAVFLVVVYEGERQRDVEWTVLEGTGSSLA